MTVDAYAADIAKRWKAGLAEWDQDGSRIARLRAAADVRVYTPGSRAGTPLAILGQTRAVAPRDRGRCARPDRGDRGGAAWSRRASTDVQPHSREQALVSDDPADAVRATATPIWRGSSSRFSVRPSSASASSTSKRSTRRAIARSSR